MKWIDTFLYFRQQRVVVNGIKSGQELDVLLDKTPCCSHCTSVISPQISSLK